MKNITTHILISLFSGLLFWTSAQQFDLIAAGTNNKIAESPKFTVSKIAINVFSSSSVSTPTSTINGDTMFVARVTQSTTSVGEQNLISTTYSLDQNFPNPFNMSTVIRYLLPEQANVTIKVYDLTGREIATIVDGYKNQGLHSVGFGNNQLATGTYLYRMIAQTQSGKTTVETKKMIVMK